MAILLFLVLPMLMYFVFGTNSGHGGGVAASKGRDASQHDASGGRTVTYGAEGPAPEKRKIEAESYNSDGDQVRRGPHLKTQNQRRIEQLGRRSGAEGSAPETAKSKENRTTRTEIRCGGVRT